MCHLAVMPISRGRAVQEGAVGRPEGPQILRCSQRKRPPPTSWTTALHHPRGSAQYDVQDYQDQHQPFPHGQQKAQD